jgi:uncharacterized DUF497 family protein
MDILFELQGVEFEWNHEKYPLNLNKHGIRFETAAEGIFRPVLSNWRRNHTRGTATIYYWL